MAGDTMVEDVGVGAIGTPAGERKEDPRRITRD
jgi:hypothetical protein